MKALAGRNGCLTRRLTGGVVRSAQEIDEEPVVEDTWFGVDPVVDPQEEAAMGGSLCEKGR